MDLKQIVQSQLSISKSKNNNNKSIKYKNFSEKVENQWIKSLKKKKKKNCHRIQTYRKSTIEETVQ